MTIKLFFARIRLQNILRSDPLYKDMGSAVNLDLRFRMEEIMDINRTLNEVLVKLFRNINVIEERALRTGEYKDVTANDMHVIEAIGMGGASILNTIEGLR